jgi:hypothetical protein
LIDFPENDNGNLTGTVSRITDLVIQLVDLLQGESFNFVNYEINKYNINETAISLDEKDF